MTLNDVRITAETMLPFLDAAKDAFWMILPYLISFVAVKIAFWIVPVLWRSLNKK